MLVINCGVPKSASTFVWQLTKELIYCKNDLKAFKESNILTNPADYVEDVERFLIEDYPRIPKDFYYQIKTHGELSEISKKLIEQHADIKTICTIRDPYDNTVAMWDASIIERAKPEEKQRKNFSSITSMKNASYRIVYNINKIDHWLRLSNVLILPFTLIKNRPEELMHQLNTYLQLNISKEQQQEIVLHFSDTSKITEYNRGEEGRGYKEIVSDDLTDHVRTIFDAFKSKYLSGIPIH